MRNPKLFLDWWVLLWVRHIAKIVKRWFEKQVPYGLRVGTSASTIKYRSRSGKKWFRKTPLHTTQKTHHNWNKINDYYTLLNASNVCVLYVKRIIHTMCLYDYDTRRVLQIKKIKLWTLISQEMWQDVLVLLVTSVKNFPQKLAFQTTLSLTLCVKQ